MFKKALPIVISSLIIGNGVAWFTGAAPIEFKKIAYSASESQQIGFLKAELKEDPDDAELMLQLGQLYSNHNEIKKADELLSTAYRQAPDDMLIKATYFANEGKLAGAMFDPAMGLYKLHRLRQAMDQVDAAAIEAKSDFNVRLVRLLTFSFVGEIGGHFDRVFEDESWFNQLIAKEPVPAEVQQLVYIALANAYREKGEDNTAADYFQKANNLANCPVTLEEACQQLSQMLVSMDKETQGNA